MGARNIDSVVTGGAGFVGSHLVDALILRGRTVLAVDNLSTGRRENLGGQQSPLFRGIRRMDLRRRVAIPPAQNYLHLASPASPPAYQSDPIGTLQVNGEGFRQVLEAARRSDGRVVLASTSEIYGDPEVHPQAESYWGHVNPNGVRSCYDEGKRFAEALAAAYRRQHGLDVRVARIFNTYGPRMDPNDGRVVSNFICQALKGRALTVYGSGAQTRSFCYVSDLVEGLVRLLEVKKVSGPVNLGNPGEVTVRELAAMVARLAKVRLKVIEAPLPPDDPQRRCPDIGRAMSELKWRPVVPLDTGLRETLAYFRTELGTPARGSS
jgi:UDP-glucuronate decarboxylase